MPVINRHSHGEALNIITFNDNQINFNEEKLSQLLLHPQVKDREIAIVSIVGAYRKGKSFFMDYCLRFMYANFKSLNNSNLSSTSSWIGDKDEALTGFSWRSGSIRDTTGLSFWSDIFLHDENLAILLVDTQGLFDPETSTEENAKILTLSTLLSSSLILNLNNVIQEDQLQYLQYATEFASLASSNNHNNSKPFQRFLFLIRDWQNVDDFEFGMNGGAAYLDQILKSKPDQSEELKSVREHIRESFDELLCCLMPYPGKKVATSSDYDGRWSAMDEDFFNELRLLIENFLAVDKIVSKRVNGVQVTGSSFFEIIKNYIMTFSTSRLIPKAQTLYELTVNKFMTKLVEKSYEIYEKNLEGIQETNEQVDGTHLKAFEAAMAAFDGTKKMGNEQDEEKFKNQLKQKINIKETEWKSIWLKQIKEIKEEKERKRKAEEEAERLRQMEIERKRKEEEIQRQIEQREREIEIENRQQERFEDRKEKTKRI
ncbi:hypothetical protein PVAND_016416 [Polypedilum vanderplanki]|uniref:GB1/RHD3-type G domain-containing protein n=1 Tax=Polypedilum vanderplanki TaxID=319348 RepID=A0A9J6BFD5_POLVA|nr:hypothetical protein PVAND_016416 [Polypedilum vanderplanki]